MERLEKQIGPTFDAMVAAISSVAEANFNEVPFEGSWTAGQVAQHVKMSIAGTPKLWNGNTKPPGREPDANVKVFASIFLDFNTKLKSPAFILLEQKIYSRQEFLDFYTNFGSELEQSAEKLDMDQLCLDFEFPNLGLQTRYELLAFVLFHTQRHTRQIVNIANTFNEKTPA